MPFRHTDLTEQFIPEAYLERQRHYEFLTRYFWFGLGFIYFNIIFKTVFQGQGATAMNVISSLVAVAGITLTIISYRYQHKYCQVPSLEGICVIGRILFNVSGPTLYGESVQSYLNYVHDASIHYF